MPPFWLVPRWIHILGEDGYTGLMLGSTLGHIDIVNAPILVVAAVDTQYGRTALILASGK